MTIRRLGSEIVHQQISIDSARLITDQEAQDATASSVETEQSPAVNEVEKARRFQETELQGLAIRNQLDAALPEPKQNVGIWDDNLLLNAPNPMEVEATVAETTLSAMTNEQLLQYADAPGGQQALAGLQKMLEGGEITAARQKQLDRIKAAQFQPGAGLQITATPPEKAEEYKATYLNMVRRTMMESPSFSNTMNEINNGTPPVNVILGRNLPNRLDSFNHGTGQTIDLSDLEKIPATPPLTHPESTTQGQVLAHAMREAREGAKGITDYHQAHKTAIEAENEYRREMGQKSMRLMPPNDKHDIDTPWGSMILVHYDDAHTDGLNFDQNGNLMGVNGNIIIPF